MTNKEIIAVIQAAESGKKLEWRRLDASLETWWPMGDYTDFHHWDFQGRAYRVKPEPREFYATEYPPVGPVGGKLYASRETALFVAFPSAKIIKLREVIDEAN